MKTLSEHDKRRQELFCQLRHFIASKHQVPEYITLTRLKLALYLLAENDGVVLENTLLNPIIVDYENT